MTQGKPKGGGEGLVCVWGGGGGGGHQCRVAISTNSKITCHYFCNVYVGLNRFNVACDIEVMLNVVFIICILS